MEDTDLEALAKSYPQHAPYVAADLQRLAKYYADESTRKEAEAVLQDWIDHGHPMRSALAKAWKDRAAASARFNVPESPLSPPPGDGKPVAGDVGGRVKVTPVSTKQATKNGVGQFPELVTNHDESDAVEDEMDESVEDETVDGARDATSVPDRFGFGGAAQRALMARQERRKMKKEAWASRARGLNKGLGSMLAEGTGATVGGMVGGYLTGGNLGMATGAYAGYKAGKWISGGGEDSSPPASQPTVETPKKTRKLRAPRASVTRARGA